MKFKFKIQQYQTEAVKAIAVQRSPYAIFKDKSFATDSVGINNEKFFKTYPGTVVKVI